MEGGVEMAILADHPMVAELLAVIGGDDDQGSLVSAAFAQSSEEAAELVVDLADHAVIGRPQLVQRAVIERAEQRLSLLGQRRRMDRRQVIGEPGVLRRFLLEVSGAAKRRHGGGVVHCIVRLLRDEWRGRAQKGAMKKTPFPPNSQR